MKLNWKYKLHSGALQFTIFISVIIALLLAGIILLAYTHRFFIEQSKAIVDNIQLSDTGIALLQRQEALSNDTLTVPLIDPRENQSVKTYLSQWGIFEKGIAISTHRNKKFTKTALLGSCCFSSARNTIYLSENFSPLSLVGSTQIYGNAVLPAQGLRPGYILGNSFNGGPLIHGKTDKSATFLPKLKYDYKQILSFYLTEYEPKGSGDFIPLGGQKKIVNSFTQPTTGYFSKQSIILENVLLQGNIIIRSSEKITVKRTAVLKDIILAAPEIIIEDDVQGNFQAIADTSLKVGKNCKLQYPTALILLEKENTIVNPMQSFEARFYNNKIFIDSGCTVKGSICYFNTTMQERDFKVNIYIGEKSQVKGEIYCEGNTELKACTIYGSIYTNYFISNEGGTTFVNHIYNTTIDSEKLPESFGGLLFDKQSKSVMQWLY